MKIGTIVENKWAGQGNPLRYFVYTGISGKYATGISEVNGELERVRYYKEDLLNATMLVPVGYCEGFDLMKADLRRMKGSEQE